MCLQGLDCFTAVPQVRLTLRAAATPYVRIAELIRDGFGSCIVSLHCIAEVSKENFAGYNNLIIGCSTWGIGKLQIDWEEFLPELEEIDFRGKKVAPESVWGIK